MVFSAGESNVKALLLESEQKRLQLVFLELIEQNAGRITVLQLAKNAEISVLLWNAQHGWISFIYQLTRAIPSQEYRLTQLLWTCFESIVCLCPSLGLPMWGDSQDKIV